MNSTKHLPQLGLFVTIMTLTFGIVVLPLALIWCVLAVRGN